MPDDLKKKKKENSPVLCERMEKLVSTVELWRYFVHVEHNSSCMWISETDGLLDRASYRQDTGLPRRWKQKSHFYLQTSNGSPRQLFFPLLSPSELLNWMSCCSIPGLRSRISDRWMRKAPRSCSWQLPTKWHKNVSILSMNEKLEENRKGKNLPSPLTTNEVIVIIEHM